MWRQYQREKGALVEKRLGELIPAEGVLAPRLNEAMRYSLFAGGKRLRPVMLMAAADAVGGRGEAYLDLACGLEMIHTYSLIHDDLPAMDDDDYRRGKPTNHKIYGDGMAVLAGDALLTAAFAVMLRQADAAPARLVAVVGEIADAAGFAGMVGGQAVDLDAEGRTLGAAALRAMHQGKTGALFRAALRAGAILGGATAAQLAALTEYAAQFGLAFQITDDILDVAGVADKLGKPVGSDERKRKATYVSLYSLDGARSMAARAAKAALAALSPFGPEAAVLRELARDLIKRDH